MRLTSKEVFLEEMDKHHSMLELDGPSVSLFSFSALLEKAVAIKGYGGSS